MPHWEDSTERALLACSAWLHIGFIGAAALAAGLLQLFDGEATWPEALALAFSGGVLAAASWRRGRIALEHAERAPAVATDPPCMLARRRPGGGRQVKDRAPSFGQFGRGMIATPVSPPAAIEREARR